MREYELTVVYDLSVAEAGGQDAGPQRLASLVEGHGGKTLKVDHWGRRRMAYPIGRALDGDYIVTRVELEPREVPGLEAALRIDERVYRHLVVRADELPPPPPPREPREPRERPAAEGAAPAAAPAAVTAEAATAADAAPAAEAPASTAPADAEPIEAAVATAKAEVSPEAAPPDVPNADVGGEASADEADTPEAQE